MMHGRKNIKLIRSVTKYLFVHCPSSDVLSFLSTLREFTPVFKVIVHTLINLNILIYILYFDKFNSNFSLLLQDLYAVALLLEALRYKPEGRGFDSRLCSCNFH